MKFDEKYPYADRIVKYKAISYEDGSIEKIKSYYGKCWNCGSLTEWYDIDFGDHICSEECHLQKISEYVEDTCKNFSINRSDGQKIKRLIKLRNENVQNKRSR